MLWASRVPDGVSRSSLGGESSTSKLTARQTLSDQTTTMQMSVNAQDRTINMRHFIKQLNSECEFSHAAQYISMVRIVLNQLKCRWRLLNRAQSS